MEKGDQLECSCSHVNCRNYGNCEACIKAHRSKDSIVFCMRGIAKKRYAAEQNVDR